jgi:hypothetical protein
VDTPLEREDVVAIMNGLLDTDYKLDLILESLGIEDDDGEEEG